MIQRIFDVSVAGLERGLMGRRIRRLRNEAWD